MQLQSALLCAVLSVVSVKTVDGQQYSDPNHKPVETSSPWADHGSSKNGKHCYFPDAEDPAKMHCHEAKAECVPVEIDGRTEEVCTTEPADESDDYKDEIMHQRF